MTSRAMTSRRCALDVMTLTWSRGECSETSEAVLYGTKVRVAQRQPNKDILVLRL